MKKYLSMLTFQYERTLIYLLQKNKYSVKKYLKQLRGVKDFKKAYKKGAMKETPRAYVLFHVLALTVVVYAGLLVWWAVACGSIWAYLTSFVLIFLIPIWAQYTIVLPILLAKKFFKTVP
jgi:hypothetical protein